MASDDVPKKSNHGIVELVKRIDFRDFWYCGKSERMQIAACRREIKAQAKTTNAVSIPYTEILANPDHPKFCAVCTCTKLATLRCSRCKAVYYCGRKHQRLHWKEQHKASRCSEKQWPVPAAQVSCSHHLPAYACISRILREVQWMACIGLEGPSGSCWNWLKVRWRKILENPYTFEEACMFVSCMKRNGFCTCIDSDTEFTVLTVLSMYSTTFSKSNMAEAMLRHGMKDLSTAAVANTTTLFQFCLHHAPRLLHTLIDRGATLNGRCGIIGFETWPWWLYEITIWNRENQTRDIDSGKMQNFMQHIVTVDQERCAYIYEATMLAKSIVYSVIAGYDEIELF